MGPAASRWNARSFSETCTVNGMRHLAGSKATFLKGPARRVGLILDAADENALAHIAP